MHLVSLRILNPPQVIAYVMKEYRQSLEEAMAMVKVKRNCINPNDGFIHQLRAYEGILKARCVGVHVYVHACTDMVATSSGALLCICLKLCPSVVTCISQYCACVTHQPYIVHVKNTIAFSSPPLFAAPPPPPPPPPTPHTPGTMSCGADKPPVGCSPSTK